MRCLRPVSRLNNVLLPELGLPTTATLDLAWSLTAISLAETRISEGLVTSDYGCNLEESRIFEPQ